MKLSYMVGFGNEFPTQVHHRSASIPWDGHQYSCEDGERWKNTKDPNPNLLLGAMVAGPDELDKFVDERDKQEFTEPSIATSEKCWFSCSTHCSSRSSSSSFFEGQRHAFGDRPDGYFW